MRFINVPTQLKDVQYLHWLPDGRFAYVDWDREHTIYAFGTMNHDGTDIRDRLEYIRGDIAPCPTNGDLVALISRNRLCIYSLTSDVLAITHLPGGVQASDENLVWSPDGQMLAYTNVKLDSREDTNQLATLIIFDRQLKVIKKRTSADGFYGLSWRPDSRQLAYWDVSMQTSFIGIDEPAMDTINNVVNLNFSPHGDGYTYQKLGTDYLSELLVQFVDRDPIRLASFHGAGRNLPHDWLSWSPNGKLVLFNGGMFYHHILRLFSADQEKVANLVHDDSNIHFVAATWNAASTEVALLTKTGIVKMIVGPTG